MTRFKAKTLEQVYEMLEAMEYPIALFDFLSGEMGYEALCAQAVCGKFYDDHGGKMPVVALAWRGCALWYENVSDVQLELTDAKLSMRGNLTHQGKPRWDWLVQNKHRERIAKIANVAEVFGPSYWAAGHMDAERLAGFVQPERLRGKGGLKPHRMGVIESTAERLARTGHVFQPPGERVVEEPYVAVFDRNEITDRQPWRNTQEWQITWLHGLGLRLVVIAGLNPRTDLPRGVLHLKPLYRDMDLLCNVVRYARLFAAPPCGAADVARIFGCDFLMLGELGLGGEKLQEMSRQRGFAAFGPLDSAEGRTAKAVLKFLERPQGEVC